MIATRLIYPLSPDMYPQQGVVVVARGLQLVVTPEPALKVTHIARMTALGKPGLSHALVRGVILPSVAEALATERVTDQLLAAPPEHRALPVTPVTGRGVVFRALRLNLVQQQPEQQGRFAEPSHPALTLRLAPVRDRRRFTLAMEWEAALPDQPPVQGLAPVRKRIAGQRLPVLVPILPLAPTAAVGLIPFINATAPEVALLRRKPPVVPEILVGRLVAMGFPDVAAEC